MEWPNTDVLDLPKYTYWCKAIYQNDVETIKDGLRERDGILQKKLLNGKFDFTNNINQRKSDKTPNDIIDNVWHMVVTLCSEEVIKLFISKGVDLHMKTKLNHNIVHSMILAAAFQPDLEDYLMSNYQVIMGEISEEDKHMLLMTKSNEGMRPLEFAMHNAATGMFQGRHTACMVLSSY